MDAMTIELDAYRVALATENANWRALTADSPDIAETLAAGLDEMRTRHEALKADLPAAIADHTAAERACDAAQVRRNVVIGRANRVAPWRLSPAMELLLDAQDRRYRIAQITATKAKQALAQLRWDIERLAADIGQTEAALAPPSPQLMEAAERPQPPEIEVDDIVFVTAPTRAA
jgi:hypothetical protein